MYLLVSECNSTYPFSLVTVFIPTTCYVASHSEVRRWLLSSRMWRFLFWYKITKVSEKVYGSVFRVEYHHSTSLKMIESGCFETSLNIYQPSCFTPLKMAGSLHSPSHVKLVSQRMRMFCYFTLTLFISWAQNVVYKMELWSLSNLSTWFDDALHILHLVLFDMHLWAHVLHFRTAVLQSGRIITLCHKHKQKVCETYWCVWVCACDSKPHNLQ
jgi:hypothetical protein